MSRPRREHLGVHRIAAIQLQPVAVRHCVSCGHAVVPEGIGYVCTVCSYSFVTAPAAEASATAAPIEGNKDKARVSVTYRFDAAMSRPGIESLMQPTAESGRYD